MWENLKTLIALMVLVQIINFQATVELREILKNPDGTVLLFQPKGPDGKPVYSPKLEDFRPKPCIYVLSGSGKTCAQPSLSSSRAPQVQGKKTNSKGLVPVVPLPPEPLPEGVRLNRYGIYPFCQEHSQARQENLNHWLEAHVKREIFHPDLENLKNLEQKLLFILLDVESEAGNLEIEFSKTGIESYDQLWAKTLTIQEPLSDSLELTKKAMQALQYLKILELDQEEKDALVKAVGKYSEKVWEVKQDLETVFTEEELERFDEQKIEWKNKFNGPKNRLIGFVANAQKVLTNIFKEIGRLLRPEPKAVKGHRKVKSVAFLKKRSPRRSVLGQSLSRATGTLGSSGSI